MESVWDARYFLGITVGLFLILCIFGGRDEDPMALLEDHNDKVAKIVESLQTRPKGSKISLHNRTLQSNTIRNSSHKSSPENFPVDLSSFNHILEINKSKLYAVVEPGITFGELVKGLMKRGLCPLVVVELPGITVGGAIAGGGLESSSLRHGQFFDTILELECLDPELKTCNRKHHADLFHSISASYNTVALVTKVMLRIQPVKKYVNLEIQWFGNVGEAMPELLRDGDTVEGIVYQDRIAVIRGTMGNKPKGPVRRFRHWDRWYYKQVRRNKIMSIPYYDYCFRYNYGAFWMADYVLNMIGDNLLSRYIFGWLLDAEHLFAVLHSSKLSDLGRKRIIQDCYVPKDHLEEFIKDIDQKIGVYPLWLCPVKHNSTQPYSCSYSDQPLINVGIYGRPREFPFNAAELGSYLVDTMIKYRARSMLYAQTWHSKEQFEKMYGKLERKDGFYGLYEKVALSDDERMDLSKPATVSEDTQMRKVVKDIVLQKFVKQ